MRTIPWHSTSTRPSMRWIPPPSIFASRCSLGRRSDPKRPPSSSIHCLICAAVSPRSSSSATARCMTSIFWINSFPKRVPSMSWIAVISILSAWRASMMPEASSSPAQVKPQGSPPLFAPVDRSTGLVCDQTVLLTGFYSRQGFDRPLRRIKFNDPQTSKRLVFLTNNFALDALTIAKLYKYRWQVELFFKWIKQHLRIKAFFGTSENAVKSQIWIAISVYVLAAIVTKRLALPASLYEILQILSLTLFEKIPVNGLFDDDQDQKSLTSDPNQLYLFN